MYLLCKVRGPKVISRFLPSDVVYLTKVAELLVEAKHIKWQKRYTLLLWASVLVLAPFELETFKNNVKQNLYSLAFATLSSPGKDRDAACILMARLITRTDMRLFLDQFIDTVQSNWHKDTVFTRMGVLRTLALTAPLLPPHTVLNTLNKFSSMLIEEQESMPSGYSKLACKFLGRVAVIYANNDIASDDVEEILGTLLEKLSDPDTLVRLSASKAVANIAKCLPSELCSEVTETVFSLILDDAPQDLTDWPANLDYIDRYVSMNVHLTHGAMLLVAELLQRKIPVDHQKILHLVRTTIAFEQRKLTYAVGSNVRDSACYVTWALFRSTPSLTQGIFNDLIDLLANAACFDREINIRRASAAAIQEGIGRHSTDLAKIEVIQALDFSRLGNRETSYLEIAPRLTQLGFHHLGHWVAVNCIFSWDQSIARLAGRAVTILNDHDAMQWLQSMAVDSNSSYMENILWALGEIYSINVPKEAAKVVDLKCLLAISADERALAEGYVHFIKVFVKSAQPETTWVKVMAQLETIMLKKWDTLNVDLVAIASTLSEAQKRHLPLQTWLEKVKAGNESFISFLTSVDMSIPKLPSILDRIVQDPGHAMKVRCAALSGLGVLILRIPELLTQERLNLVLCALDDYSVNVRGDIGSWLRRAGIKVGVVLCESKHDHEVTNEEWVLFKSEFVKKLVRLSMELLDNVREDAVRALNVVSEGPVGAFFKMQVSYLARELFFSNVIGMIYSKSWTRSLATIFQPSSTFCPSKLTTQNSVL